VPTITWWPGKIAPNPHFSQKSIDRRLLVV
jgi:hypothetical protein